MVGESRCCRAAKGAPVSEGDLQRGAWGGCPCQEQGRWGSNLASEVPGQGTAQCLCTGDQWVSAGAVWVVTLASAAGTGQKPELGPHVSGVPVGH